MDTDIFYNIPVAVPNGSSQPFPWTSTNDPEVDIKWLPISMSKNICFRTAKIANMWIIENIYVYQFVCMFTFYISKKIDGHRCVYIYTIRVYTIPNKNKGVYVYIMYCISPYYTQLYWFCMFIFCIISIILYVIYEL